MKEWNHESKVFFLVFLVNEWEKEGKKDQNSICKMWKDETNPSMFGLRDPHIEEMNYD